MKAGFMRLFPSLCSVSTCWWFEMSHRGDIHTMCVRAESQGTGEAQLVTQPCLTLCDSMD